MQEYLIVIENAGANFCAYSPDVQGCIATGASIEEVTQNMREALEFHLESIIEDNEELPIAQGLKYYLSQKEQISSPSAYLTNIRVNIPQAA
ncbi:MAG: type II toxin-antitoxin system HicB family antitoxin [Candidatus Kapaibacterium sp.]|nr:MAG: type II toxin-antitoxin system HicB family antitoxin [Candidatus Kapabacteria bacterium]